MTAATPGARPCISGRRRPRTAAGEAQSAGRGAPSSTISPGATRSTTRRSSRRHLLLCWILGLHLPALFAFGVWQGYGVATFGARDRNAGRLPGLRPAGAQPAARRASSSPLGWCSARRCWSTSPAARSRPTSTSSSSSASSRSTRTGCRSSGTCCSRSCPTASAAPSPPTSCSTTPRRRTARGAGRRSMAWPCWPRASA